MGNAWHVVRTEKRWLDAGRILGTNVLRDEDLLSSKYAQ